MKMWKFILPVAAVLLLAGQAAAQTDEAERQRAMDALGDQFDIKEFHNIVIGNGSLPLEILEQLVDEYIANKQKQ